MDNKILTIVQARTGSTRLPGKVLMPILSEPVLFRMMERLKGCQLAGTLLIATTTNPNDDVIENFCKNYGYSCFRGSEEDLLDRHYQAAIKYEADIILKIPSDCPLIDPLIVDEAITFFMTNKDQYDYVSNLHPATYPDGNDVEIFTIEALKEAWEKAERKLEREHTTPYFWENPGKFRIGNIELKEEDYSMTHRCTLDYIEDYEFIKYVYERLFPINPLFGFREVIRLMDSLPEKLKPNQKYAGVNWYRYHLKELKTITTNETRILEEIK